MRTLQIADGSISRVTAMLEEIIKELKKAVDKKYSCITDLMDHAIEQSENIYRDKDMFDNFYIFHDGLSLWWTKSAQDHMRHRGYYNRQIMCAGPTNADNRYHI